ncbi:MAG: metal-sensitive transcriptional regulator, partial [Candidatus Sericytochromatia bacterium]
MTSKSNQELIHRLNRAIGQLEAIKKTLASEEDKDCIKTIRLLKAANNAIKKFGEAYVNEHLSECML